MSNRMVPGVSERQVEVLRLARDGGRIDRAEFENRPKVLHTIAVCEHHRWLAPRGNGAPTSHWQITDGGRAALAHFDGYPRHGEALEGPRRMSTGRPLSVKCPKCMRGMYGKEPVVLGVRASAALPQTEVRRRYRRGTAVRTLTHVTCQDCGHTWWTTLIAPRRS